MKLTLEEVEHIAALARLELSEDERHAFQKQLSSILEYVEKLKAVDTEGVEPMNHSIEMGNVLRRDEAVGCDAATRQRLIDAFPAKEGDQLKVDAVFS
jgi:aspartyl-tRNA(Asn)/glutamyl-tRNA(Gln) amidotransferase subunit C